MRTDWTRALHNAGVNQSCTRIEIKPHTRTGVNEGVGQLLGSRWCGASASRSRKGGSRTVPAARRW